MDKLREWVFKNRDFIITRYDDFNEIANQFCVTCNPDLEEIKEILEFYIKKGFMSTESYRDVICNVSILLTLKPNLH